MKKDLSIFDADGNPSLGTSYLEGADRLAQRVLYELSTPYGTIPGFPTRGTTLTASLVSGSVLHEADLIGRVSIDMTAIRSRIRTEVLNDGESEISYYIDRATISEGAVSLTIVADRGDNNEPSRSTWKANLEELL